MYKRLNYIVERNPLYQKGDGWQNTFAVIVPTPCTPFGFKQAGKHKIRPGQSFKVTYNLRNILTSTLTESIVELNVPAGMTLMQTYAPKRYTHERPVVEDGVVLVKLHQVPACGTAKITLLFKASSAVSGTLSFPYTVHVPRNYCYQDGAAAVRTWV